MSPAYDQLAARLRAGEIRDLRIQQTFTLQEAYVSSSGDAVRAITYKADFTYTTLEEVRRCDPQEVICSDGFEDLTGSKQPWTNEIGRMGSEIILADGRFCVERKVVEDVKGARTETYKIKKKLMEERGYHVREV